MNTEKGRGMQPYDRCILCGAEGPLTEEHIIPRSLGGILSVPFLCQPCNSQLGASELASMKRDPSVRLAIEALQDRMTPGVRDILIEDQDYVLPGPGAPVKVKNRQGKLKVSGAKQPDGSLILNEKDTIGYVRGQLQRQGLPRTGVDEAILKIRNSLPGIPTSPTDDLEVVKWQPNPTELQPALDGPRITDRALAVFAFEFLATLLGGEIYRGEFDKVRDLCRTGDIEPSVVLVERLHASDYQPLHGIALEAIEPHAVVQVRFFGWLAFRVHFPGLRLSVQRYAYTVDLAQGTHGGRVLPASSER